MSGGARPSPRWIGAALALVLLVGLALRLHGLNFGLPGLNDPDEMMFQMGAIRMLSGPTLNPGWFGHPATTTIYLLAVINVAVFVGGLALGAWSDPDGFAHAAYFDPGTIILPGRLAIVAFAIWSIWLTWRLARDLAGPRVGLVAAAVLAANPVHISYSQIVRSDMMATCFMLLVMLAALRVARGGGRRDLVLGALWLGLGIVTKWPFAVSSLAMAGALALRVWRREESVASALRRLMAFGVLGLLFGLMISPFIVLDYPTLLLNLAGEAQPHHLGATGGTPLANAWWYLSGPILASLGLAGALAAVPGLVLLARRREALAIVLPMMAVFFAMFCFQRLVWERWGLPLTPALSIAAALGLAWIVGAAGRHLSARAKAAMVVVLALVVLQPQVAQALVNARVRTHDTRQMATAWVRAHIPPGATILVEHQGFDLLQGPYEFLFPTGNVGCVNVREILSGKTQYDQIEEARDQRSNVDYGTLNPAKRGTCGMDWAVLTQYDRYAAERGTFPKEYAAYVDLLSRGTIMATFAPVAGESGGPIVRVVRFHARRVGETGKMPPLRR
jgi:Dolichyl-phosphate-mannose-protein mannosyltransferase